MVNSTKQPRRIEFYVKCVNIAKSIIVVITLVPLDSLSFHISGKKCERK